MDLDVSHSARYQGTGKSLNGCWTCRLRRKKCDQNHPVCNVCSALCVTCHYEAEKPEWMDGARRQGDMAEQLKREVRDKAYLRRGGRASRTSLSGGDHMLMNGVAGTDDVEVSPRQIMPNGGELPSPVYSSFVNNSEGKDNEVNKELYSVPSTPGFQNLFDCNQVNKAAHGRNFGRSDTILFAFYLENLFPFLFPFYRPALRAGGRAWVLDLTIRSPVVRQATLCHSSYFFSLLGGPTSDAVWEKLLTQSKDIFGTLREALRVIESADIMEHLCGAVRVITSIIQVQRFDIAVLSFEHCETHLSAALALFKRILDGTGPMSAVDSSSSFQSIMSRLGPPTTIGGIQIPSAEQAAFDFSSALLIFDDIIASTVLQEQPRLYEYHYSLLLPRIDGTEPAINLEKVVGCHNWTVLQISEITVLDAWKQKCIRAGTLDMMALVNRAKAIKDLLESYLTQLEGNAVSSPRPSSGLLDAFKADYRASPVSQSSLVTTIWTHAALIYLFVVVSGWQPANAEVRSHIERIIELLSTQISPPSLLSSMSWPFCVAGCLAEPAQEASLRKLAQAISPSSISGTVRKALEIMERIWRTRDMGGDMRSRDLAACFRSQEKSMVLLV